MEVGRGKRRRGKRRMRKGKEGGRELGEVRGERETVAGKTVEKNNLLTHLH